jgi:hypothetical protein
MPPFNLSLHWDLPKQQEIIRKVETALQAGNSNGVCRDVGLCIEKIVLAIYAYSERRRPRNMKVAIDFIGDKAFVSKPLAAKMHLVRELRNLAVHDPDNAASMEDARYALRCLTELFSWINRDQIRNEWQSIVSEFEAAERELSAIMQQAADNVGKTRTVDSNALAAILARLYVTLDRAAEIKLRALGEDLSGSARSVFSRVDSLAGHGINVRSPAWRDLVAARAEAVHSSPNNRDSIRDLADSVYRQRTDLKNVLARLNPLDRDRP